MKTCTKCGCSKQTTEFSKDSSRRDGLECYCKTCRRIASSAWRAANPDKVKANNAKWNAPNKVYVAKWRHANPEKAKAAQVKWKAANKNKTQASDARRYAANPKRMKANHDKWRAENPQAIRIYKQNRRAREFESGGRLSTGLAERLFKLQRGKCACCGLPLGNNYHLDHIMPLVLGGANTDNNIQLLRQRCNHQKHSKHPVDFMQQRGFLI